MIKKLFVVMVGLLVLPMIARADILDLTDYGRGGYVNDAYFYILPQGSGGAGSGAIDSFVRIQAQGNKNVTEQGYNTSYRGTGFPEFDENTTLTFTHDLQLSTLQNNVVQKNGIDYYEIVLDVNELTGQGNPSNLITIHQIEIYIVTGAKPFGYPFSTIGTLQYELDAGTVVGDNPSWVLDVPPGPDTDHGITLDYDLFAGSGAKFDMVALFPVGLFGTDYSKYFVLYSEFGDPDQYVTDGYEEWARIEYENPPPPPPGGSTPEPGTLILLGSGLAGLAGYGKLRFGRKRK